MYALVLLRRMEVECGSERFTVAGTPCQQELGTLGVVKVIKSERNQAIALAMGRNAEKHRVAGGVEILHSKPPGVPVETRWCIGAVH
jgi:hypothetical protein